MRLGTDDSVKDILNFSVALASLVLAVIAIVQALISGGQLNEAIGSVKAGIVEIREPAERISNAADVIQAYSSSIGVDAVAIRDTVTGLVERTDWTPQSSSVANTGNLSEEAIMPRMVGLTALTFYVILKSFETGKAIPLNVINEPMANYWVWGYFNSLA